MGQIFSTSIIAETQGGMRGKGRRSIDFWGIPKTNFWWLPRWRAEKTLNIKHAVCRSSILRLAENPHIPKTSAYSAFNSWISQDTLIWIPPDSVPFSFQCQDPMGLKVLDMALNLSIVLLLGHNHSCEAIWNLLYCTSKKGKKCSFIRKFFSSFHKVLFYLSWHKQLDTWWRLQRGDIIRSNTSQSVSWRTRYHLPAFVDDDDDFAVVAGPFNFPHRLHICIIIQTQFFY